MQYPAILLSLTILTTASMVYSLDLQFSHFPLLTDRSDVLPLPPSATQAQARPTGRPGLVGLDQRDSLLALLGGSDDEVDENEDDGGERQRQKMSRKFDSFSDESTVRISRSRSISPPRKVININDQVESDNKIKQRKIQRRFRHRFDEVEKFVKNDDTYIDNTDSEDNDIADTITNPKVRARSKEVVLKRRKTVKKNKIKTIDSQDKKLDNKDSDEDGGSLRQRRLRVRPVRPEAISLMLPQSVKIATKAQHDAKKDFASQRIRPRKKVNKEAVDRPTESETLSRFRTNNKDIRSKVTQNTKQTANKNTMSPQIPRLLHSKATSVPVTTEQQTIEPLNIDSARIQQPQMTDINTKKNLLSRQDRPTPKNDMIVSNFKINEIAEIATTNPSDQAGTVDGIFLPTIRNLVSKKSRKRLRKVVSKNRDDGAELDEVSTTSRNIENVSQLKFRLKQNPRNSIETGFSGADSKTDINVTERKNRIKSRGRLRGSVRSFSPLFNRETTSVTPLSTSTSTTMTTVTTTTTTTTITTITTTGTTTTSTTSTTTRTTSTTTTATTSTSTVKVALVNTYKLDEVDQDSTTNNINPYRSRGGIRNRVSTERTIHEDVTVGRSYAVTSDLTSFYDLEKALEHAEKTWAQDPFRKLTGLPGKPIFDIDYSKNPATSNEVSSIADLSRNIVPSKINNSRGRQKPVNQRGIPPRADVTAPVSIIINQSDQSRISQRTDSEPIESFLWTPALLKQFQS